MIKLLQTEELSQQATAKYSGDIENGKLCGKGQETWSTGIEFKGEFLNNMRHGRGRMLQRDGTVYEGNWREGLACGYGILHQPDGFKYYGFFKDNLMVYRLDYEQFFKASIEASAGKPPNRVFSVKGRCKSAKMRSNLSPNSISQHKYNTRPLFNHYMNAL